MPREPAATRLSAMLRATTKPEHMVRRLTRNAKGAAYMVGRGRPSPYQRRPPTYPCDQRPAPTGSASRACSSSSAHSNSDAVAGWGLRLRPLGFTGSSAMNSAQENSVFFTPGLACVRLVVGLRASSERHTQSQSQRQRQEFQQGGNERHGRITDTSRRRRNGHDGTVRGTERDADSQPHTAPGQLRQGLVLDDDGHLPRREVGRAGVSAEARRQRHRHALPHRGLLSGRGDNAAGGPHRAAHLDGLRARERRDGQGP